MPAQQYMTLMYLLKLRRKSRYQFVVKALLTYVHDLSNVNNSCYQHTLLKDSDSCAQEAVLFKEDDGK